MFVSRLEILNVLFRCLGVIKIQLSRLALHLHFIRHLDLSLGDLQPSEVFYNEKVQLLTVFRRMAHVKNTELRKYTAKYPEESKVSTSTRNSTNWRRLKYCWPNIFQAFGESSPCLSLEAGRTTCTCRVNGQNSTVTWNNTMCRWIDRLLNSTEF